MTIFKGIDCIRKVSSLNHIMKCPDFLRLVMHNAMLLIRLGYGANRIRSITNLKLRKTYNAAVRVECNVQCPCDSFTR